MRVPACFQEVKFSFRNAHDVPVHVTTERALREAQSQSRQGRIGDIHEGESSRSVIKVLKTSGHKPVR